MRTGSQITPFVVGICSAIIAGALVASYFLFFPSGPGPVVTPVAEGSIVGHGNAPLPARLIIPDLHIDAEVESVGRTSSGLMGNPSNFTNVAWYREGTVPGDLGSAVIGGHLDNALGLDGVFKHLSDLKIGEEVDMRSAAGDMLRFRVTGLEEYTYEEVPQSIFTRSGGAYLNLVTCAGTWLPKERTYDHRLIVYTELIQS